MSVCRNYNNYMSQMLCARLAVLLFVTVCKILYAVVGGLFTGLRSVHDRRAEVLADGYLLSRGPGTYKIPSCSNIPIEFNVTLLKDSNNSHPSTRPKSVGLLIQRDKSQSRVASSKK